MAEDRKCFKVAVSMSSPGSQGSHQPHIHRTHRQLLDARVHEEQLLQSSCTRIAHGGQVLGVCEAPVQIPKTLPI